MLIPVIYRDNEMDLIDASHLNELIASNKIKKFLRSEGWVTISRGHIRRSRPNYFRAREAAGKIWCVEILTWRNGIRLYDSA